MSTRSKSSLATKKTADAFFSGSINQMLLKPIPLYVIAAEAQWDKLNVNKKAECFRWNRALLEGDDFVGLWWQVRKTFFDAGFHFIGAKAKAWLKKNRVVQRMLAKLNSDLWTEFLLNDSAIVFWIKPDTGKLPNPIVLDSEATDYSNGINGEKLKIWIPQNLEEAKKAKDERWRKAYQNGDWVELDPDKGEMFAVITRAKAGNGLGMPRLKQVYRTIGTRQNLQIADWAGAHKHRDVIEHCKVGFEPKLADLVKRPALWGITKEQKEQIEKERRNKRGPQRFTTDWRVNFEWKFLDPKFFDVHKYDGTNAQLDRWGGPTMMLLGTGQPNPFLIQMFATEGRSDRDDIGALLNMLLDDPNFLSMRSQPELEVAWDPHTFDDPKSLLEKFRFLTSQGLASVQTSRAAFGLDDEEEGDRLALEKTKPERATPVFEPKQGMLNGGSDKGGRPGKGEPSPTET